MKKPSVFFLLLLALLIAKTALAASSSAFCGLGTYPLPNTVAWLKKPVSYLPSEQDIDLKVSLDQQQYPFLEPLIQQFARKNSLNILVSNGTCGISAGRLRKKTVDIGGYCCPPGKLDRLPGLQFHTLGIASLAIIANTSVPVTDLTRKQAQAIFSGNIRYWSEIKNGDAAKQIQPITPVIRPHCKKRPGHWKLLLPEKQTFSSYSLQTGAIPDMIKHTISKPYAIGYETQWMINAFDAADKLKILTVDGIRMNDYAALATGKYPFYRTFNLTTWNDAARKPAASRLIQWLQQKIRQDNTHTMVDSATLKANGWQFSGEELTGAPDQIHLYGQRY